MHLQHMKQRHLEELEKQRKEFEEQVDELRDSVQWMREEGETDLRSVLSLIDNIKI